MSKSLSRREIAMTFQLLIDRFQRDKKRLPYHVEDLKVFSQRRKNPLDLSMFYFLKIIPISRTTVRINYSVKKTSSKFYMRTEYLYESIEITGSGKGSTKESELFPRPKLEGFLLEF